MSRPEWLAPLETQLTQGYERYAALQPRERKLVLAATAVIALALLFLIVWQPVADARRNNAAELSQARATAAQIARLAARAPTQPKVAPQHAGNGQSLLTVVDLASRSMTSLKAPSRLQPDGEDKVRVWFKQVSFGALLGWVQDLHKQHGISVINADISARKKPGMVDARFSVQGPK